MGNSKSKPAAGSGPQKQKTSRLKGRIAAPSEARTAAERRCAAVRSKRDAHSLPSANAQDTVHLGLSWDQGSTRPVDLDLQCCLFDSMGLMLDACFFNNPQASGGAMRHTGDSLDGKATGEDEGITVCLPQLPPHAYAVICGVYCHGTGTLGECRNVGVSVCKVDKGGQRGEPIGRAVLNEDPQATAAIVFTLQRVSAQEWTVDLEQITMDRCRTFVDAFPAMQQLLHVDPALQEEFKSQQPVFNLKKGGVLPIPYGLTKVGFGLGWDAGCDVDASVICFSDSSHTCVYFGNKEAFGNALVHSGDNLTGEGEGDDETIFIDLAKVPAAVTHLFLVVNVYTSGQDFRHVKNEFARVYSNDKSKADYGMELLRVGSLDDYGRNDGVVLACLSRDKFNPCVWQFKPVGVGERARTCSGLVDKCNAIKSQF